ncbi:glycoside hydrolase family 19 protein [Methylobacterium sp. NFXW15]|uniref:glycoside hydrolase family 19 protein n=1 Tax=Methylobacterium sp. NFXW15 TaxID=2819512 RepID=UPI003CEC49FC
MNSALSRAAFFARLRESGLLGSRLSQTEVDGLNGLLDAWDRFGGPSDPRHVAYTLATAWHECRLDLSLREIGKGHGHPYGAAVDGKIYYGRGAAQLTWLDNYRLFGQLLGVDLVRNPDLALVPATSAAILVIGARDGLFRKGHRLSRYFDATTDDPIGARAIINGDGPKNGAPIAGYHGVFLAALRAASEVAPSPVPVAAALAPATALIGLLNRLLSTLRLNMQKGA